MHVVYHSCRYRYSYLRIRNLFNRIPINSIGFLVWEWIHRRSSLSRFIVYHFSWCCRYHIAEEEKRLKWVWPVYQSIYNIERSNHIFMISSLINHLNQYISSLRRFTAIFHRRSLKIIWIRSLKWLRFSEGSPSKPLFSSIFIITVSPRDHFSAFKFASTITFHWA